MKAIGKVIAVAKTSVVVIGLTVLPATAAMRGDYQAPRGEDFQAPRGQDFQAPRGEDFQAPRGQDFQAPRR